MTDTVIVMNNNCRHSTNNNNKNLTVTTNLQVLYILCGSWVAKNILEFPLVASSKTETAPTTGKSWHEPLHGTGGEQAPITLIKSVERG